MKPGHFAKFGAAYIRGALYALIAFLAAFTAEFESLKEMTSAQLQVLTCMFWVLAWAKILGSTAITMRAFFDNTLAQINQQPAPPTPGPASAP